MTPMTAKKNMKNEIETAIKSLAAVTEKAISPDEAMKYAQSVLNLANALAVIERIDGSD